MKKILFTFVICCFAYPLFAQIPFVGATPIFAEPAKKTPSTYNGHYSDVNPLSSGTFETTTKSSNVQKSNIDSQSMWFKAIRISFNDDEWQDCNIKILISADDSTIKIFANKTHTIHLYNVEHEGYIEDAYIKTWNGRDENGEKCLLDILMLDNAVMLNIEHENFSVRYGIIPDE